MRHDDGERVRYRIFDEQPERFDSWYDRLPGRDIFRMEVACLRPLIRHLPGPWLEVGAGTGRFAQALGASHGVDPAIGALRMATSRGVRGVLGLGEELPYVSSSFGAALVVVTLCFADDPLGLLRETRRVLKDDGGVIVGIVPRESPWGEFYLRKKESGHPFYAAAKFYSLDEVKGMLGRAGFSISDCRSVLFQPPGGDRYNREIPRSGCFPEAGFVGILALKS